MAKKVAAAKAVAAEKSLLKTGALQGAIFNSAYFSSIATDEKGVIQIFNVGAETDARLHRAGRGQQDHPGRHLRPAGADRPRRRAQPGAGHADHARLRGAGVQGLARHRGHLRAHLHPQGRQPLPGDRLGDRAARRARRHHRLPADRHRQHRPQARRGGAAGSRGAAERHLQQRQLLQHRHRREGRHPDLQRRRRAHARLRRRRRGEPDHPGRHLRSAGTDRARRRR